MIGRNPGRVLLVSMVALLCVLHSVGHATVYSWKGEGGVLMLSNDPNDVPADQQGSVRKFISTPAPAPTPVADDDDPDPAAPPPRTGGARGDAYQRGFDAGLEAGERQVALASELARTVLAAVPQTQPAPIVIEQSAPAGAPYGGYGGYYDGSPYYAPPYYGFGYPYPFFSGFVVSSFPRRRFFPGFRGRRFAPFFPHGGFAHGGFSRFPHGGFAHAGFGFGRMR